MADNGKQLRKRQLGYLRPSLAMWKSFGYQRKTGQNMPCPLHEQTTLSEYKILGNMTEQDGQLSRHST